MLGCNTIGKSKVDQVHRNHPFTPSQNLSGCDGKSRPSLVHTRGLEGRAPTGARYLTLNNAKFREANRVPRGSRNVAQHVKLSFARSGMGAVGRRGNTHARAV